mgnify:FL=1|jgi:hypothetical protein
MSYKSENWQDKLKEVRQYGTFSKHSKGSLEESADDIINKEIEEELRLLESQIEEEIVEEEVILEASAGDMIDKLFNLKGDKDSQYGVAKMLSMTGVKVVQSMQKQNPQGFSKLVAQLGKEKKITLPTNNKLMAMFKDAGVKPMPEEVEVKESVEKSIEKLTEKNMLGRLAKQLQLNEEGKQKMFDYFTKGELEQ